MASDTAKHRQTYQGRQKEKKVRCEDTPGGNCEITKRKSTLLQGPTVCQRKRKRAKLFKIPSTNSRKGQMDTANLCGETLTLVIKRVKDALEASNQIYSVDWPK